MKVAIGSDHAGFVHKEPVKKRLEEKGFEVIDIGTDSEESTDYPIYAFNVAKKVQREEVDYGVLICGTGIGMSIAANKVKGVRAAACQTDLVAKTTRQHNHANVICFGGRTNSKEEVLRFTDLFFDSIESKEKRHVRRVRRIKEYEG